MIQEAGICWSCVFPFLQNMKTIWWSLHRVQWSRSVLTSRLHVWSLTQVKSRQTISTGIYPYHLLYLKNTTERSTHQRLLWLSPSPGNNLSGCFVTPRSILPLWSWIKASLFTGSGWPKDVSSPGSTRNGPHAFPSHMSWFQLFTISFASNIWLPAKVCS